MKKIRKLLTVLCFLSLAFIVKQSNAATMFVSDTLWSTELWSDTVYVQSNVVLLGTLDISAGTKVLLVDNYYIKVGSGSFINASGTSTNPIIFKPIDGNEGIGWDGIDFDESYTSTSTFNYCEFHYSNATYAKYPNGGAIMAMNHSNLNITNCLFKNNFAENDGGALYFEFSTATVSNCFFTQNNHNMHGTIASAESDIEISQSIIVNNGGNRQINAFNTGQLITIKNNTIANNYGHPVWIDNASLVMSHNIISNNDMGIGFENVSSAQVEYNFLNEPIPNATNEVLSLMAEGNLILFDPMFVLATSTIGNGEDGETGNWELSTNSYCINAGIADTTGLFFPLLDYNGNGRIYTGTYSRMDIGAYEFQADANAPQLIFECDLNGSFENTGLLNSEIGTPLNTPEFTESRFASNQAFSMPGSFQNVTYSGLTPLQNNNQFTISLWIKPFQNNVNQEYTLLSEMNNGSNWKLSLQNDTIIFTYWSGTIENRIISSGDFFIPYVWNLVTVTYDGTDIRFYKNDYDIAQHPHGAFIDANPSSFNIGLHDESLAPFNGLISDIKIFDKAVSLDYVSQLYYERGPYGEAFKNTTEITFEVNMNKFISDGSFNPETDWVDIVGTFNEWTGSEPMTDDDGNGIYELTVDNLHLGNEIRFKFRVNGNYDGINDLPGGNDRTLLVSELTTSYYACMNNECLAYDIIASKIINPQSGIELSAPTAVEIEILNAGTQDYSGTINLNFSINGGTFVNESVDTTILTNETITYTFSTQIDISTPNVYDFDVVVFAPGFNDYQGNDTIREKVFNKPLITVYPHIEDFETTSLWEIDGANPSWEFGAPSGTVINSAYSGANVAATNLSGNANTNEQSYIYSPFYQMLGNDMMVTFKMWRHMNETSGVKLQMMEKTIGAWMDLEKIDTIPELNHPQYYSATLNSNVWAGHYDYWDSVTYIFKSSFDTVQFRFVFASESNSPSEGFAFDDFTVMDLPMYLLSITEVKPIASPWFTSVYPIEGSLLNYGYSEANGSLHMIGNFTLNTGYGFATPLVRQNFYLGDFDLSATQSYNINLYADDVGAKGNSATISHEIIKQGVFNSFPYIDGFEDAIALDSTWVIRNKQYGKPSAWAITNNASAYEGTQIASTNEGIPLPFNQESYLESPGFDLSSIQNPVVSFYIKRHFTNEENYATLLYSTSANIWEAPYVEQTMNWGSYYLPNDEVGGADSWTKAIDEDWVLVRAKMPNLAYMSQVQFKFVIKSGNNWQGDEGISIDKFTIEEAPADDLTFGKILSPLNVPDLGVESISVDVINEGTNISSGAFDVSYSINGSAFVTENISPAVEPGIPYTHTFVTTADLSTYDVYHIRLAIDYAADGFDLNDTVEYTIVNQPGYNTYPVLDDFEGGTTWLPTDGSTIWMTGTPSGTIIDSAYSGTNAIYTNLTDNTVKNVGIIESPYFDFSLVENPGIQLKIWKDIDYGQEAGVALQYTLDSSQTWYTFGDFNDHWYQEYRNVITPYDYNGNGNLWSGKTDGYISNFNNYDSYNSLGFVPQVKFRLIYAAEPLDSVQNNGFAFDDILVYDATNDAELKLAILDPITSAAQQLNFEIKNIGYNEINSIDLSISVDGQAVVTENITEIIFQSSFIEYTTTNTFDLSAEGNHTIFAYLTLAGDGNVYNDTIFYEYNKPKIISTFPYSMDFESIDDMIVGGQNASWQMGSPAGSVINYANSGTNCYMTNLTGNYNINEVSWIETPVFDFSGVETPIVEFKYWLQTDEKAALTIQASTDGGMYWENICYNDIPDGQSCQAITPFTNSFEFGLIGQYAGWRTKKIRPAYGNYSNVRFRIGFSSSDDAALGLDGVAIDDIYVYDAKNYDLELVNINQHNNVEMYDVTANFNFFVFNLGNMEINDFNLYYSLNDGAAQVSTISGFNICSGCYEYISATTSLSINGYGEHKLKAWIEVSGDENQLNDTLEIFFTNSEGIMVDPEVSFDNEGIKHWAAYPGGDDFYTSWERGIPDASTIIQSPGNNVWKTGLGSESGFREYSYLQSPGFGLSNIPFPAVEFDLWRELGPEQLVMLQYYMDGQWRNVGAIGDTSNWYTPYALGHEDLYADINYYGDSNIGAWTNFSDGGWVTASHNIFELSGYPEAQLRFIYRSRDNWEGYEGFAFDNFRLFNNPPKNDVAVNKLITPINGEVNATDTITISVINNGTQIIDSLFIDLTIHNVDTIYEEIGNLNILSGEERVIKLPQILDLSTNGIYYYDLYVTCPNDNLESNNYVQHDFVKLNRIVVDYTTGYQDSFEGAMEWMTFDQSPDSWERGVPSAAIIDTASDGTNCWVTNLDGFAGAYEAEILSPIYDLRNVNVPQISFDKWSRLNPGNGVIFQYTADFGESWITVNEGINWYNEFSGLYFHESYANSYWSGMEAGWSNVSADIPQLGNEETVIFRLLLNNLNEVDSVEGFAFDNFMINDLSGNSNAKVAYIEHDRFYCSVDTTSVVVNVTNVGHQAISNFDVVLQVDTITPLTQNITATLNPGDTVPVTFTGLYFNVSNQRETLSLTANTNLLADEYTADDTLAASISVFNSDWIDMPGWQTLTVCDGYYGYAFPAIDVDIYGRVWVASMYGGITMDDGNNFERFGQAGYPNGVYSWALEAAPDGKVWWSNARGSEIWMYENGVLNEFIPVPGKKFEEYIYAATNGDVWFASYTDGSVLRYNGSTFEEHPYFDGQHLSSIGELVDGTIIISSYGSEVYSFKDNTFEYFNIPGQPSIEEIFYEENAGLTWFGGYDVLLAYDGTTWYDHSSQFIGQSITDIDDDIYGNLWIATSSGNLIQYDGSNATYYTSADGLVETNALYAVAGLSDGRVAAGSWDNGISVFSNGPVANFFYTIDSTTAYFFDSSVGGELTYNYSFGDGTVADSINPVHTYASEGVFEVCLTVVDTLGRSNTFCDQIQVGDTTQTYCFAQFDFITIGDSVFFTNLSSENTTNYFWDFGDNTFSTEMEPVHEYMESGYYEVFLTVEDTINYCQEIYSTTVYIEGTEISCFADFYYDVNDKTINFTNASLGSVTDYLWDFGDGLFASSKDTSHTYTEAGVYYVCLTVFNDTTGCMDEVCLEVIVSDSTTQICQADYSYVVSGAEVSFNAQVIGTATNYLWHFGDGNYSELKNPIHVYDVPDFYQVELTIFDSISGCLSSKFKTIVVSQGDTNIVVCNADFSQFVDNGTVTFTNNSSDNITDYIWDFGDGKYSFEQSPVHTYASPDYYEVCLSVFDSVSNCIDEYCKIVPVTNVNTVSCNANFEYFINNKKVVFNGNAIGDVTDYFWDFGDGNFGFEKDAEHTYAEPGFYYVEFIIFDEISDCMDVTSEIITIIDSSGVQCNANFEYYASGKKVTFNNLSEGSVSQYFWDLGDGNYSTDTSLVHTYTGSGYYPVELTVYNDTTGCLDSYYDVVFVIDTTEQFCQAGYTYYTQGNTVTFTDNSNGEATDYFWDFGDGNYSTDTNATNTYSEPGYYEVIHTVYNSNTNCLDEYWDVVVVIDTTQTICNANFSYFPNDYAVSFTSEAVGDYKQIFWDFDDGTNSNIENPVHVFNNPGYYNVSLTVVDTATECFDTRFKVIFVEGSEPLVITPVKADYSQYVVADTLTAFFTNKSLGSVETWYWDFGDNTPASADTSPVHKYAENDYYRTCLTVSNSISLNTKCKFIPVGDVSTKNTAFFTYYADSVTTTAYFNNKSLGDIVSYHWDFGDGYDSDQKNPAHAYADTGYYAVCLSTTSSVGRVRTYCVDVRIGNAIDDPCLFSCVWPGDANNDLEANHYDLLTIGLNYGMEGPRREEASTKWYGQFAQNWSTFQLDSTNNKHGDCNGDGIINALDTIAIAQNFAYSHTYQPDVKANEWDLSMEWVDEGAKATGRHHKSRVILTRPSTKNAGEIYGLGYEIEIKNDAGVVWDSISISFNNSWLGDVTDNLLAYYEVDKDKKMIFVAAVKNDQISAIGSGTVTEVNFYILDGYSPYDVSFNITTLGGIMLDGSKTNIGGSIELNLGDDKTICEGSSIDLTAPSGYASYLWSNGSKDTLINVNSANIYWCQVIDTSGMIGVDTVIVTTNPLPEPNLGADVSGASSYELTPGSGFSSYLWSTDETTETITVTTQGTYWVEVTNEFGCTATDSIDVSITGIDENKLTDEQLVIYPNPNNGSFWIIINEDFIGDFNYQLYDMKGKLITTDETKLNGSYKEIVKLNLTQGLYYFKAQINDKYTVKKIVIQ